MTVTIIDLGPQGNSSTVDAVGLNQAGQVSGSTTVQSTGVGDAFSYQNGILTLIGLGPVTMNGYTTQATSSAFGLNDAGLIIGAVVNAATELLTAAEWLNGKMSLLPSLGSIPDADTAFAVNNGGQIVGTSNNHAVLWQSGTVQQLDTGGTGGSAYGINDSGQVVGVTYSNTGSDATLWQNGKATYVGSPGASAAYGINKSGEVVGSSWFGTQTSHAFSYLNGTLTELTDLNPAGHSQANAVNTAGWVVGQSMPARAFITQGLPIPEHAALWLNGNVIDLNSLLPASSGWVLTDATAINDQGQIAGTGTHKGQAESFVLDLNGAIATGLSVQQAETQIQSGQVINATISDSASNVGAALDALQTLAASGELSGISLTDSGFAKLPLTPSQISSDAKALALVEGNFYIAQTLSAANLTVSAVSGHGNVAVFSGPSSDYSVTPVGDGNSLTVTDTGTGRTSTDKLSGFNALQFSDVTEIIAQTPGIGGTVTTGKIAELYSAVLAREPDISGLAYYQTVLKSSPSTSLLTIAEYFLGSPEYTGNPQHNYAQSAAGDAQFITDSYNNLLHRAPESGAIPFYQNVIGQYTQGLTPGTAAYAQAQTIGHATVLVYFSASQEFLNDVQITAQQPASVQHWLTLI